MNIIVKKPLIIILISNMKASAHTSNLHSNPKNIFDIQGGISVAVINLFIPKAFRRCQTMSRAEGFACLYISLIEK